MRGQIELQVEAREITALLFLNFLDLERGEHHPAFRMVGMWKRKESSWERILLPDLFGAHGLKFFSGHPLRKCDSYPFLDRLTAGHRDIFGRAVGEVVPIIE